MNILILTSAMVDSHFSIYQEKAKIKPNPSNQNFYSKLIKCLAIQNNVKVVTLRPFAKGMFKEKVLDEEITTNDEITYFYVRAQAGKIYKIHNEYNEVIKTAKTAIDSFKSNDFVIIVDSLRYNLCRAAIKLGELYGVKVVPVLTDNPANLSNVNVGFQRMYSKLVSKGDAFISLTRRMVDNINPEIPAYIFEGLTQEEIPGKKGPLSDYFFFAGSLYDRYGVRRLIEAFHNSSCKTKLVIAGNGPLDKYIESISHDDQRILFLSQISKDKVIAYEKEAFANINPRPLNEKLDNESVPSKFFEYITSGTPTISTRYPKFVSLFKDDIYWINGESAEHVCEALENFEKENYELLKKKALNAKVKALEIYGLKPQCEAISHFLLTLK